MTAVPPRGSRARRAAVTAARKRALRPLTTAVLAALLLPAASAQAGTVATYEVESFKPASSSRTDVIADADARAEKALLFSRTTSASKSVTLQAATDKVVVRARGVACNGAPRMAVTVDGMVVGKIDVPGTYTEHTFTTGFAGGGRSVKIAFENGYGNKSCRRKLVADQVRFVAPGRVGARAGSRAPAPAPAHARSDARADADADPGAAGRDARPDAGADPGPDAGADPGPDAGADPVPTPVRPVPTRPDPRPDADAHAGPGHGQAQVRPAGAEQPRRDQGPDDRPEPVLQRRPRTSSSTCPTCP